MAGGTEIHPPFSRIFHQVAFRPHGTQIVVLEVRSHTCRESDDDDDGVRRLLVLSSLTMWNQGPPAVCILSGAGSLCEVILWVSAIGTVTHEDQFDITSLSRSFVRSESGVTGGLNLTMTRADGSLFGGVVEGKLSAATPVQVVLRSVFPDTEKLKSKPPSSTLPPNELNFGPPLVTKVTSPSTPSSTHLM
ncbi:hypothetical protein BC332_34145 [Capsicum chinense]|nr:hypothetical protein BC332_34145 [Capsicum chinense]